MIDIKTKTFDAPNSTSGENIGTGDGATDTYTATLSNTPIIPGTVTISVANESTEVTDDGEGNLVGDVNSSGNNTINYDDGSIDVQFDSNIGDTNDIDVAYDNIDITIPSVSGETANDTPDGSKQVFKGQLNNGDIVPNSVTFKATIGTTEYSFNDNGEGVILDSPGNGHLLVGHIQYSTGDFYLRFESANAPDDASNITADYSHSLEDGNAEILPTNEEEFRGNTGFLLTEEDGNDVAVLFEYSNDKGNSLTTKNIELVRGYGRLLISRSGRFKTLRVAGANGAVNVRTVN